MIVAFVCLLRELRVLCLKSPGVAFLMLLQFRPTGVTPCGHTVVRVVHAKMVKVVIVVTVVRVRSSEIVVVTDDDDLQG